MTAIVGSPRPFLERLGEWYELKEELAALRDKEMAIRLALFGEVFEDVAGTQRLPIQPGWQLEVTRNTEYKVDITHLGHMRDEMSKIGQPIDNLLRWKAELNVKPYKTLPENARTLFDNIITSKLGAPSMNIVPAKDAEEHPGTVGNPIEPGQPTPVDDVPLGEATVEGKGVTEAVFHTAPKKAARKPRAKK